MAITSLVMGILGWTLLPFIGTVVAIITGHIAKGEIKKSGGRLIGDGMATTGLVLGYAQVALSMCLCLVFLLFPALLAGLWNYGDSFIR